MKRTLILSFAAFVLAGPAWAAVDCETVGPYARMESASATTFEQYFGVHPLDAETDLLDEVEAALPGCMTDLSELRQTNIMKAYESLRGRVAREARVQAEWEKLGKPQATVLGVTLGMTAAEAEAATADLDCREHETPLSGGYARICKGPDGRLEARYGFTGSLGDPRVAGMALSFTSADTNISAINEAIRAKLGLVMRPVDYEMRPPEKWETDTIRAAIEIRSGKVNARITDKALAEADQEAFEAAAQKAREEQLGTGVPNF